MLLHSYEQTWLLFLHPKRKKLVPLLCDVSHKHSRDVNQQWGTPDTIWNRPWYNPLPHDTMVFHHTNLDTIHRLRPSIEGAPLSFHAKASFKICCPF
jgi:hypothetical protein